MIELWFDGICEPQNPGGHGGFGMLVKRDGETIHQEAHYVGRWPTLSNNCTEYAGAIAALRYCLTNQITEATIYGDADMIIKQLEGKWRAHEGAYTPYYLEAMTLRQRVPGIKLKWIPREMNGEADELSRLSVSRQPQIITFELDATLDTSPAKLTPRTAKQQRQLNRKRQRQQQQREATRDEMMDLFMQHTADI